MTPVFVREAIDEVADAIAWLDEQQEGLGSRFGQLLNQTVDRIQDHPQAWPVIEAPVRRALVPVFDYGVFYRVDGDRVTILACAHPAREPGIWRSRV